MIWRKKRLVADTIQETELTSGLFYGYVVVDLPGLLSNLGGNADLAGRHSSQSCLPDCGSLAWCQAGFHGSLRPGSLHATGSRRQAAAQPGGSLPGAMQTVRRGRRSRP